jgi:hypothetical protein
VLLDVGEMGDPRFSLHTYTLIMGDLTGSGSGGQRVRLYNAYLQYKGTGRTPVEVSAGRQRVYEGVGYGTLDGLRLRFAPRGIFSLTGYAGVLAPLISKMRLEDWSDGHVWGFHVATERLWKSALGFSFVQRDRKPASYALPGRYSGQVFDVTSLQQRLAGMDFRHDFGGKADLDLRIDYDLLGERMRQAEGVLRVRTSDRLNLAFEGIRRSPVVNANAIFSVFDIQDTQEYALRGNYRANSRVSLYGNYAQVVYEGARAHRVGVGFGFANGSVGYTRRIGEGGENDALSLSLFRTVNPHVTLRADGGLASYRIDPRTDRLRALSGVLGITVRPHRRVTLDAEAQGLRDRIYADDFRFFFRGSVWFFKKSR